MRKCDRETSNKLLAKPKSKLEQALTEEYRTMKFGMFTSPAPLAVCDDSYAPPKKGKLP